MTNSFLYDLVHEMYAYSDEYEPPKDKIFEAEAGSSGLQLRKETVSSLEDVQMQS